MKKTGTQYQKPELMDMNLWKPYIYGRSGGTTTACDEDMGSQECPCEGLSDDHGGSCTVE